LVLISYSEYRNEEGDKELEKERERIMPFITFQQVTTTSTSTNAVAAIEGTNSVTTVSEDGMLLPPLDSDGIENGPDRVKSQPPSPSMLTTVVNGSIEMTLLSGALGLGNGPSSQNRCSIVEVPPEEEEDLGCASPGESKVVLTDLSPGASLVTGEMAYTPTNQHHLDMSESVAMNPISSPSAPALSPHSTGMASPGEPLPEASMDQIQHTLIYVTKTHPKLNRERSPSPESHYAESLCGTRGSQPAAGNVMPRLKRSLADVEDLVVSSAKRTILPSTFLSSYSPLHHHSSHLSAKWGTETSTIIFDQHNNNG